MEITVLCLTFLCVYTMFRCKKAERRIHDLEAFVEDVNKAVANVAPAAASADVAG